MRRRRAVGFYTKGRGRGRKVIPITARYVPRGVAHRKDWGRAPIAAPAAPPSKEAIEVTAIGEPVQGEDQNIHFEDTLGGRWTVRPEGVNEVGNLNGHPILEVKRKHIIRAPPSVETPQKHIESLEPKPAQVKTAKPKLAVGKTIELETPKGFVKGEITGFRSGDVDEDFQRIDVKTDERVYIGVHPDSVRPIPEK